MSPSASTYSYVSFLYLKIFFGATCSSRPLSPSIHRHRPLLNLEEVILENQPAVLDFFPLGLWPIGFFKIGLWSSQSLLSWGPGMWSCFSLFCSLRIQKSMISWPVQPPAFTTQSIQIWKKAKPIQTDKQTQTKPNNNNNNNKTKTSKQT